MSVTTAGKAISASVASRAGEMTDLLVELVRAPTVSGDEPAAEPVFASWFAERGWQLDRQILAGTAMAESARGAAEPRLAARANLTGWYGRPCGRPVLSVNAHYDVVPVIDEEDWTDPPFAGTARGGAVFGRGAVDNKGGCVAALFALQALADAGVELPFDVAVEFVAAEETTGVGTVASLEQPWPRLAAIVMEPTQNAVVTANSGAVFFTVGIDGRAVHTSVPWRGEDALRKLVAVYEALHRFGDERAASCSHPLMTHLPSPVPLVVGKFQGGGWRAALPAHATMSGRVGVLPGEPVSAVKEAVEGILAEVADGDEWLRANPPKLTWDNDGLSGWEMPLEHPLVEAMSAGRGSVGLPARFEGLTTGCDAGTLRRAGVPVVVFGPGDLARAHSPNEYVLETEVTEAAVILANALVAAGERFVAGDWS
ncbi:M20 family metallopeptidase [Streptomyces sp. R39]|uniref:M20 family metallopeptidase n=1 Tax=Streptomyces sp. R39 TaxID=3238631 RepID=A0AB39QZ42_9ACTN